MAFVGSSNTWALTWVVGFQLPAVVAAIAVTGVLIGTVILGTAVEDYAYKRTNPIPKFPETWKSGISG